MGTRIDRVWERWNSYTHEKGFGDAGMNSFKHYAYGAVGEWMIDPAESGFRKILIQLQPGGGLTWAKGRLESPYGVIATDCKLKNGSFSHTITIPPNATATIRLPNGEIHETVSGTHSFEARL